MHSAIYLIKKAARARLLSQMAQGCLAVRPGRDGPCTRGVVIANREGKPHRKGLPHRAPSARSHMQGAGPAIRTHLTAMSQHALRQSRGSGCQSRRALLRINIQSSYTKMSHRYPVLAITKGQQKATADYIAVVHRCYFYNSSVTHPGRGGRWQRG